MFATQVRTPQRGLSFWFVVALLLMCASEVGLRLFGFGNTILYVPDEQCGYYPAPHQNETRYGGRIETNAYGMRAPDFTIPKPPDTIRILMLGDSTLWGGSYIEQDDLYARRLQKLLSRQPDSERVEILNMGVNGWGPFHKRGFVERFGTFQSDIAVICLLIGDVHRRLYGLEAMPFMSVHSPPRFALQEVLCHLIWRYRASSIGSPDRAQWQAQEGIRAYADLASRLRRAGCEVLVEVLPERDEGLRDPAGSVSPSLLIDLKAAAAGAGVPVGYPVGLFHGKGKPESLYRDNWHLDRLGHSVYAGYLAGRLRTRFASLHLGRDPGSP
jgi:hypothetical protein